MNTKHLHQAMKLGVSRRTLLQAGAGLAGGALLQAPIAMPVYAEDHAAIGTYPAGSSGSCEITLNEETDNATTYRVDGQKLTFTTRLNDTPVAVYSSEGGTQIDGISGHNVWIGQWG